MAGNTTYNVYGGFIDNGNNLTAGNPQLGPLQDNGGPTFTMLPAASSPAIDTGSSNEATDQRGVPRPHNGIDDIGAVEVVVEVTNSAPTVSDAAASTPEDTSKTITLTGSDADAGDTLTFKITALPTNGTLSSDADGASGVAPHQIAAGELPYSVPANNNVLYIPASNFNGDDSFKFKANDGTTDSNEATISLTVTPVNDKPTAVDGSANTDEDTPVDIDLSTLVSDVETAKADLTYSIVSAPAAGAGVLSGTGSTRTFTPALNYNGAPTFTFKVTDSGDPAGTPDNALDSDTKTITITVKPVNDAPTLTHIPDSNGNEGELITFTAVGADVDSGSVLKFSLKNAPAGASINPDTGVFTWTPTEAQGPGVYTFTVVVSDGTATAEQDVTITVLEVNQAPVVGTIADKNVNELSTLAFTVGATDGDLPAQTLTYSLVGAPVGASIGGATGAFSWTPSEAQGPNTYNFSVRVSDGVVNTEQPIKATVNEVNVAPFLPVIGSKSVNEGSNLAFTISAATDSDLPANTLTYSATNLPTGASFNTSTRAFSWTPTEAQGPNSYNVAFKVSDGTVTVQEVVTITVNEVNTKPVLTAIGNKTFLGGRTVSYTASATDADLPVGSAASTLTYSLVNPRPGLTINPTTGVISGYLPLWPVAYSYITTVKVSDAGTPLLSAQESITVTVNPPSTPAPSAPNVSWTVTPTDVTLLFKARNNNSVVSNIIFGNTWIAGYVQTSVLGVVPSVGTTERQLQPGGSSAITWSGFNLAPQQEATLRVRLAKPVRGAAAAGQWGYSFSINGNPQNTPFTAVVITP